MTHTIGPLEPSVTYPEIRSDSKLSEEIRNTLNQRFHEEALSVSCIYGYSSKDDLLTSLDDVTDNDFKKRISEAKLKQATLAEIQKFYAETRQPENSYGYHFLLNKNLLLSGIITIHLSCNLGEAHPNYWQYGTTIDLTTGEDITL